VALSSLVEELSLKVTGIKCAQTSDDSLFASCTKKNMALGSEQNEEVIGRDSFTFNDCYGCHKVNDFHRYALKRRSQTGVNIALTQR